MVKFRQLIALMVTAALVWLSVAGSVIAASAPDAKQAGHWQHHTRTLQAKKSSRHAHHAPSHDAQQTGQHAQGGQPPDRDCAAACLDVVAAKLAPSIVIVKAPEAPVVSLSFHAAATAIDPQLVTRLAYWPAAPPDGWNDAGSGGAGVLARYSHLRI